MYIIYYNMNNIYTENDLIFNVALCFMIFFIRKIKIYANDICGKNYKKRDYSVPFN